MDMIFFPHNSMFAYQAKNDDFSASTYLLRINNKPVGITRFPYWKKDFMESSLSSFAEYVQKGKKVYLHQYFASKPFIPDFVVNKLLPSDKAFVSWPAWYVQFSGHLNAPNARIELYRHNFYFFNGLPILKDSMLVYKNQ